MFNFWWSAERSEQWTLTQMQMQKKKKMQKGPYVITKIIFSFLDYIQLLVISRVIWASNVDRNVKKNERRPPVSSKNKMLGFGLHSTSDDQSSDLSNESCLKCEKDPLSYQKMKCLFLDYVQLLMISQAIQATKSWLKCDKRPPKSLKNEMLIFGLHSISDDQSCNPSNKSWLKCGKRPLSHQKMKYSFLYYIQLLMMAKPSE